MLTLLTMQSVANLRPFFVDWRWGNRLSTLAVSLLLCLQSFCAEMCQEWAWSAMQLQVVYQENMQFHSASKPLPTQSVKQNCTTTDQSCHIWCPPAGVCVSKSTQIEKHIRTDLTMEEEEIVSAAIQSGNAEVHPGGIWKDELHDIIHDITI